MLGSSRTFAAHFFKERGRTVLFVGGQVLPRPPRTDDSLLDGLLDQQVVGGSVWVPLAEFDADGLGLEPGTPDGVYPVNITIEESV